MAFETHAPASRLSRLLPHYHGAVTFSVCCALGINFLFASDHDLQRCVEFLVLGVMTILLVLRAVQGNAPAVPRAAGVLLMVFLALGAMSAVLTYSVRHAVFEWSMLLLLIALIFSIAHEEQHDENRLTCLLHWISIVCGLYSLKLLIMYAAALASGFQPDVHSLAVGFSNARFLNHTQTALLPLIVLLYLRTPKESIWRTTWFTLAAFWWALLFVCEARASILALGTGCAAAFALRRSHARPVLTALAWTAVAGVVLYALLFILFPLLAGLHPLGVPSNVIARTVENPTSARNLLWTLALKLIVAHPWLGVGPQHFAHHGASLSWGAHPHSWILQIAAEWGIPALLCLLGVLFLGARALVRSGARLADGDVANQQILVILQVACLAIFVDGLLSGVIVMPQSQLAIALVLGIACAWVRRQNGAAQTAEVARLTMPRIVLTGLVVLGYGGLMYSVAPDIAARARHDALTPAALAFNPAMHWPRMWEAGYF